jgi:hypothetical protein
MRDTKTQDFFFEVQSLTKDAYVFIVELTKSRVSFNPNQL